MVESLKALNKICQKPDYKTKGNWMVRRILRPAALPITWLLLHTSVTANQVTGSAILLGLLGNIALAATGTGWFLTGTILLQIWYLLDHVDGQIARYRKTSGLTGRFYDFLMHHLIHGTLPFALGWYTFAITEIPVWILIGFIGSISLMLFNMLYDIQYKTFFEKILAMPQITKKPQETAVEEKSESHTDWRRKGFSAAHKSIEMHVLMNTLTAGAFVEFFFFPDAPFRGFFCLLYCLLIPALTVMKYALWISQQRADKEFNRLFLSTQNPAEFHE